MLNDKQEHRFYGSIKRNWKKKKDSKIIVFNKLLKEGLKEEKYFSNLTLILKRQEQLLNIKYRKSKTKRYTTMKYLLEDLNTIKEKYFVKYKGDSEG
ncbi:hypothetical protein ABK040_014902 [Willaertia magna]